MPLGTFDDSGDDPLDAFRRARARGRVHRALQRHRPAGDLAAAALDEDGLPIGVQLVAPFGREDVLIRVAAQLERARPWADRTPARLRLRAILRADGPRSAE